MSVKVLKQGAEARLYVGDYKGERCLIKERFIKRYRHPELDTQLTRQRMKAETKAAGRCLSAGVMAPRILHMDLNERKIYMEYYDKAITAKQYIQAEMGKSLLLTEKLEVLCQKIGTAIGKLHQHNVVHGDLTTSNILVNAKGDDYDVVFIDFGLSQYSQTPEDKGVDLYVLERALLSSHSQQPQLFERILLAYQKASEKVDEETVVAKLEEVRARGRKRTMIG